MHEGKELSRRLKGIYAKDFERRNPAKEMENWCNCGLRELQRNNIAKCHFKNLEGETRKVGLIVNKEKRPTE